MIKNKFSKFLTFIGKNNGFTKAASFMFLFFAMIALFTFIIAGLYRFGLVELPEFVQNLFPKANSGDGAKTEMDDGDIYNALKNSVAPDGEAGFALEISAENIREMIAGLKLPDNLHLETTAHYYKNGAILRTEEMSLWKKGSKFKYILNVNSVPEESCINDAANERIENFATKSVLKRAAAPEFSFDSIPHAQNINHYLDLIESGEIMRYSIKQNSDSNAVEIKYRLALLDSWELIYISLDTGIVSEVRSYAGRQNDQYYDSKTKLIAAYYDGDEQSAALSPIEDSLFEIK